MLQLVTMPEPSGRFWTLTVLGTPVASGHVADDGKAISAAVNWCHNNGYEPRGMAVARRTRMSGGERTVYEAAL